jgi:hypothetical protein
MEAELTAWLHGFEPGGTPVALRIRTFADLRDEAERPRPRFVWLRPTVSAAASLGAVALVAGAIMVLSVILGGSGHGVGGPGPVGPGGQGVSVVPGDEVGQAVTWYGGPTQNPVALLLYFLAICLAGATVLVPRVRWAAGRVMGLVGEAAPSALLPYGRSVRKVSPLAWLMGAAAIVLGALILLNRHLNFVEPPGYSTLDFAIDMSPQLLGLPLAFVIALRYSMSDRSSRFLLIGAVTSLVGYLVFTLMVFGTQWLTGPWSVGLGYLSDILNVAGVATVIGLAGRAGLVRKPPLWLAALALGAAFAFTNALLFLNWFDYNFVPQTPDTIVSSLAGTFAMWISATAGAGILWIGIATWRRNGGSWAWRLILLSGICTLISWLTFGMSFVAQAGIIDPGLYTSLTQWLNVPGSIGTTALLLALAIGLRPVPPAGEPQSAELDPDSPDEIAPGTEVAGEAAGH